MTHLFLYFPAKVETNTETPKTNMKIDMDGNIYGPNTGRIRMISG
jgi:diacylglycerol kinase family enzyme